MLFYSNKRKREDNENLKPSLAKKIRSSSGETEEQMNNLSLSNNWDKKNERKKLISVLSLTLLNHHHHAQVYLIIVMYTTVWNLFSWFKH